MHDSPDSYSGDWEMEKLEMFLYGSHSFLQCVKVARYWLSGLQTLCSVWMGGEREKALASLRSSRAAESFEKCLLFWAPLRGKTIAQPLMRFYQKSVRSCFTDKRKEEIDHQNYSQAADLSSFKVGRVAVAAYFPLCKHWYFSPRHFRIAEAIWQIIFLQVIWL